MKKILRFTLVFGICCLLPNVSFSQSFTIGPPSPSIGSNGAYTSVNHYTIFSVLNPNGVYIDTVDIYPTASVGTPYTIVLQNSSTTVIATYTDTTTVSSGPERVPINLYVPAGTGYRMGFSTIPAAI